MFFLLTVVSPSPSIFRGAQKGKEALDLLLGDRGGSSGHGQLQNLSPQRTCIFRENEMVLLHL